LLQGLARARITSEFETGKLYRRAQVQILEDIPCCSADKERSLRAKVAKRMGDWFTHQPDAASQLERLVHSDLTLGDLCDIFSFALPLDSFVKMDLLTTLNIEKRAFHVFGCYSFNCAGGWKSLKLPLPVKTFRRALALINQFQ